MRTINKLATALLLAGALVPAMSAQTPSFTGKWEGTVTFQRPDGSISDSDPLEFNFTQKGKELTGTIGSGPEAWKVDKGVVEGATATFDVQDPDGPLMKFSLTLVKEKIEGDVQMTRNGVVRGKGKIEAAKAQ
jgi:hypothetical protein